MFGVMGLILFIEKFVLKKLCVLNLLKNTRSNDTMKIDINWIRDLRRKGKNAYLSTGGACASGDAVQSEWEFTRCQSVAVLVGATSVRWRLQQIFWLKTQFIMSLVEMDWNATSPGRWNDMSSMDSFHVFLFVAISCILLDFNRAPFVGIFGGKSCDGQNKRSLTEPRSCISGWMNSGRVDILAKLTFNMYNGVKNIQRHGENQLPPIHFCPTS